MSLHQAAWLISAFALCAGLVGPVATFVFSRRQAGNILPIILVVFGLTELGAAVWPSYWLLLTIRFGQGALLTPFLGIASATAAALAKQGQAGKAIGRVPLGTVLGSVLVVPAALALANVYGWRAVYAGLGLLTLCTAMVVYWALPRHIPIPPRPVQQSATLWSPHFIMHLLLTVLTFTAMFASYTYVAAFLEQIATLTANMAAVVLFVFGMAGIVGSWAASHMVEGQPTVATVRIVALLIMAAVALPWAVPHRVLLIATVIMWGAAHNAAFVACLVRVMFAAREKPALGAAFNISAGNVGMALGALWGSQVIRHAGMAWMGMGTVIAGILALIVGRYLYNGPQCAAPRTDNVPMQRHISVRD